MKKAIFIWLAFSVIFSVTPLKCQWILQYQWWSPGGHIQQTQNGGYIVPLTSRLVKISESGYIEWQYNYFGGHWTSSISQTGDGGCITAGDIYSYYGKSHDLSVMKISPWGEIEWQKSYGLQFPKEFANSIQQTIDQGYIVAGYTLDYGGWDSPSHMLILKLTSSGKQEWHQEFTYRVNLGLNKAFSVLQTSDGGYIVAGSVGAIRNDERLDACIMKLTSKGKIDWIKLYGGDKREAALAIQQTSDAGYIVAGYEKSSGGRMGALIMKLFPSGEIEWQKSIKRDMPIRANYISQTADRGYVVAGSGYDGAKETDIWFFKLTEGGNIEWQKTFSSEKKGAAYSIQPENEGGYIIYAGIEDQSWRKDHWLSVENPLIIKISSTGDMETPCDLIQDMNSTQINTNIVPREVFPNHTEPNVTHFPVYENDMEERGVTEEFTLLWGDADLNTLFPPINFQGEKVLNRSLFMSEYINFLNWEHNLENTVVSKYRIYQFSGRSRVLVAEVSSNVLSYWHRDSNNDQVSKYFIVSVDDKNKESYPSIVIVR